MLSHNPALTASTSSSLEYVLDHKELHNFATQIARGMKHLHERQITHRYVHHLHFITNFARIIYVSNLKIVLLCIISNSNAYINVIIRISVRLCVVYVEHYFHSTIKTKYDNCVSSTVPRR